MLKSYNSLIAYHKYSTSSIFLIGADLTDCLYFI